MDGFSPVQKSLYILMGNGFSFSENESTQIANANLAQQYGGSCSIKCDNELSSGSIAIINSNVQGNVDITQSCSANGQCMITSSQNAASDVFFKAANSAAAGNAAGIFPSNNIDIAINKAYQDINQTITQTVNEKCDVSVNNNMSNVDIYAQNSNIGGSLVIGQNGVTNGNCNLSNQMQATALATGTIDNCAITGKKAKTCGGKGSGSILTYILYAVGIIVAFVVIMFVIRFIRGSGTKPGVTTGPSVTAAPAASPVSAAALPQGTVAPPVVVSR